MTDIVFSFDTEDFTSPYAANAILDLANILRSEGIRGCFCIVGLLGKQLVNWGRTDILEALKYHEINFHTYGHTLHPTICEYTENEDFDAAYREVIRQESAGINMVRAATGAERIYAAVPPGNDKSYAAMYAYADMGVPCYCDTFSDDGRGTWFCNQLHMEYFHSLEEMHKRGWAEDKSFRDELASRAISVVYNHPNTTRCSEWWDVVNYQGTNKHPFGQWVEAKRKTPEETNAFLDDIRRFIKALKADGRFQFKTYAEIYAERRGGARYIQKEDLPAIREAYADRIKPLSVPCSLCVADVFGAAVSYLRGAKLYAAGRVHGFLDTPAAITEPVTVSVADVTEAAAKIDLDTFLPERYEVGGVVLGPADMLMAMLGVLCGETEIALTPREQNIDLTDFPNLANPPLTGWHVHAPDFDPVVLTKRLPLQAWTMRF